MPWQPGDTHNLLVCPDYLLYKTKQLIKPIFNGKNQTMLDSCSKLTMR